MTSLVLCLLLADTLRPGVVVQDEGVRQGRSGVVNCVGTGVVCSLSAGVWTITAAGGGAGTGSCLASNYVTAVDAAGAPTCSTVGWTDVQSKPSVFPPDTHSHGLDTTDITGTLPLSKLTDDAAASKCLLSGGAGDPAWSTCPGGGPDLSGEPFVTSATSANLTTERVLTAGTNTTVDTATAGQIKVNVADAAAGAKGAVQLAGDLGGTAASPSVSDDSHAHGATTISGLDAGDTTTGTFAAAQIPAATSSAKGGVIVPAADCNAAATAKVLYTASSNTFSCGTDQTGGGGGSVALASDVGANSTTLVQTWPAITFTANKTNIIDGVYVVTTANASTGTPRPGILTGGLPTGTVCTFQQVVTTAAAPVNYILTAANTATAAGTAPGTYNHTIPFWCVCTGASCASTTLKLAIASEGAIQVYAKAGSFYRQQTLP